MTSSSKSKGAARATPVVPAERDRGAKRKPASESVLRAKQDAAVYRVNARFDADVQCKLDYLARALNSSTSEVLREAVNFYYENQQTRRARKRGFIESLIGSAQGPLPADLSENYKRHVAVAIARKHGHR